ncbi:MAG: glycosyltransferase, partial [Bacteroidales bacterium]|nr:glycosyltransferase [Bacteroidales bacterium]
MKKSILFIIDSLTCGGAEKSLVSLLPLLDREKYELHLWMLNRGGEFESLLPADVILEHDPRRSTIAKLKSFLGQVMFSFMLRFNRCIGHKEHPAETLWKSKGWAMTGIPGEWDVAIAYQQGLPTYLVASKIKAKHKMAWVNVDMFKAGYNVEFNLRHLNKMDHVIAVSQTLSSMIAKHMTAIAPKLVTILDVLNPQLITTLADAEIPPDLPKHDINSCPLLVTVARVSSPKNYLLAVETASALRSKGIDFHWLFVGDGPDMPKVKSRIDELKLNDIVIPLGLRTNPYPYMKACDVYVQTSRFEGFGLTVGEAKILHKPIVSTNFTVVTNQLIDGKNGLIAEMNPESLSTAIIKMLKDPHLRQCVV